MHVQIGGVDKMKLSISSETRKKNNVIGGSVEEHLRTKRSLAKKKLWGGGHTRHAV